MNFEPDCIKNDRCEFYKDISRVMYPDWLGWVIIDLLNENHNETEEHIEEIKRQLDFEVRMFYST